MEKKIPESQLEPQLRLQYSHTKGATLQPLGHYWLHPVITAPPETERRDQSHTPKIFVPTAHVFSSVGSHSYCPVMQRETIHSPEKPGGRALINNTHVDTIRKEQCLPANSNFLILEVTGQILSQAELSGPPWGHTFNTQNSAATQDLPEATCKHIRGGGHMFTNVYWFTNHHSLLLETNPRTQGLFKSQVLKMHLPFIPLALNWIKGNHHDYWV